MTATNKSKIMSKRISTLAAILTLFVGICMAETPLKLTFQTTDNNISSIEAKSLTMSVNDNKLFVSNGNESLEFDLAKLAKMYFTGDRTSLKLVSIDINGSEVTAYTLDGRDVGKFASVAAAVSSLPVGVYVLRTADNTTLKVAVR